MCVVCDLSPNTVGRMSMAFNGDGHIKKKKKFQGEKKERRLKLRKIKTDVNTGTLILSDGFKCVCL